MDDVLIFHIIRISLLGCGMFVAFAPAHYPAEGNVLAAENTNADYYTR